MQRSNLNGVSAKKCLLSQWTDVLNGEINFVIGRKY